MENEIESVIVWRNGMVAVFDRTGEQMPDFQGPWCEKRDLIEKLVYASGRTVQILFNAEWKN